MTKKLAAKEETVSYTAPHFDVLYKGGKKQSNIFTAIEKFNNTKRKINEKSLAKKARL